MSPRPPTPFLHRASRIAAFALVLGAPGIAAAQLFENANWTESEVPPPPEFVASRAIPIDMPATHTTLKFGVDPATIVITKDGVVRYVVVSSRPGGGTNAYYEGIHCASEEVKTYARFNDDKWEFVSKPEWLPIGELKSAYAKQIAYQGMCRGHAPQVSVVETVRILRKPIREVE